MASSQKLDDQKPPQEREEPGEVPLLEPKTQPEPEAVQGQPAVPEAEPRELAEAEPAQPHTPIPDSDDEVVEEYVEPSQSVFYYAWVLVLMTFVALVVPLSIFLLPYTPAFVARRTPKPPWETVPPNKDNENTGPTEEVQEDCDLQSPQDQSPPLGKGAGLATFVPDPSTRHHRNLFCVFDNKYHRTVKPYLPKNVPYTYCTYILFYSVSLFEYGVHFKRPQMDPSYLEWFNDLKRMGTFQHYSQSPIPVILTAGGDVADGANISRALRSEHSRLSTATQLVEVAKFHGLQGINLHWEHPTAQCGRSNDTENLVEFFKLLGQMKKGLSTISRPFYLTVTIPARLAGVERYATDQYVSDLDYILVSTHELNQNITACGGRRQDTTDIMTRLSETLKGVSLGGRSHLAKLCFSMSVGPNTFTAEVPYIGVPATRGAPIDPASRDPLKAGFYKVCNLPGVSDTGDSECSLSFVTGSPFLVATYMTPENIRISLGHSYKEGLGDTCVVVFDMDLDDFAGECPSYKQQHSPLTAAIISA